MPQYRGIPLVPQVQTAPSTGKAGGLLLVGTVPQYHDGTAWKSFGGGGSFTRALIDVGPLPQPEFWTVLTDSNIKLGDSVQAFISGTPPASKDADEPGMDVIDVWCQVLAAGQLTLRLTGQSGYIADQFYVDYTILKAS